MDHSNKGSQPSILDYMCQRCETLSMCPANILKANERKKISNATIHNYKLDAGEHLFWPGSQPQYVYVVQSGSFKTYIMNAGGCQQITGFYFPGDILGFNSFGHIVENYGAMALESATVCKTPVTTYEEIEAQYPALSWAFLKYMSKEISLKQRMLFVLGKMKTEHKIAFFLIQMSAASDSQGRSPVAFDLSMKRSDIANYLGIAIETVSRVLKKFKDMGVIDVEKRKVSIIDFDSLYTLCHCDVSETALSILSVTNK